LKYILYKHDLQDAPCKDHKYFVIDESLKNVLFCVTKWLKDTMYKQQYMHLFKTIGQEYGHFLLLNLVKTL